MKKICISRDWTLSVNAHVKVTDAYKLAPTKIDLPNDFCISMPRSRTADGYGCNGFFQGGSAVYEKYMKLPADTEHLILDIDGAYMQTDVSFNEELVAQHYHGYTPFLTDLTEHVRRGATNRFVIKTCAPQPSTRWYSGGGLYRDVYLWTGGRVRIEPWDMFVTTVMADEYYSEINASCLLASDRDTAAKAVLRVLDADGETVTEGEICLSVRGGEKTPFDMHLYIRAPHLWDDEHPYLYTLIAEVYDGEELTDTHTCEFGIRTLSVSAKGGLRINGREVKLRGGCLHHTHAALGAADYPAAVERQLRQLKEAGFNAIRSAHNPPSLTMLSLCDRLGIYLMDEAFDMWREGKTPLDYHRWFEFCWDKDIAAMVLRDRNHPSVISYSIGNEIMERGGASEGAKWSRKLTDEIRKYDTTRPVTSGICGIWMSRPADAPEDYLAYYNEKRFVGCPVPTTDREVREGFGKMTEAFAAPLDIVGYNYLYDIYEQDHEAYPDRVMWGSETWAITFYDSWMQTLKHPYVIGDFCWTCYDNLGENGTGRSLWARDGVVPGITVTGYDWISCFQGDFDLAGFRRPQSYYREAIFKGCTVKPRIFTTHPTHTGEGFTGTQWHFYDVHETWTFPDEFLGKPTRAEVYTLADRVEWTLNGRAVGESTPEGAIAAILLPYERGTLKATLFKDGACVGEATLETHGEEADFTLTAERDSITADGRDLVYLPIDITDASGAPVVESTARIDVTVKGGELRGIFSGAPTPTEEPFRDAYCHAFEGHAVAVVSTKTPGTVTVTATALGKTHTVEIEAQAE